MPVIRRHAQSAVKKQRIVSPIGPDLRLPFHAVQSRVADVGAFRAKAMNADRRRGVASTPGLTARPKCRHPQRLAVGCRHHEIQFNVVEWIAIVLLRNDRPLDLAIGMCSWRRFRRQVPPAPQDQAEQGRHVAKGPYRPREYRRLRLHQDSYHVSENARTACRHSSCNQMWHRYSFPRYSDLPLPGSHPSQSRMNNDPRLTRRSFLRAAATLTATSAVPRWVLGGPGRIPPSDRLNVAIIGTGGQGITNLQELLKNPDVNISAICDVAEFWDNSHLYYGHNGGRGPAQEAIAEHRLNPRSRTA